MGLAANIYGAKRIFALKGWGNSAEVDRIRKAFLTVTASVIAGVFIAGFNVFAAAVCVLCTRVLHLC